MPYAVAFSSGTAALHAACFAAGLHPGKIALTSALTFVASANCARYLGADVAFADIDPTTLHLEVLEEIYPRPDVFIPVHFAGLPYTGIRPGTVIEDACHALGARTEDGPIGNCAKAAMTCFSFHPAKAITAGEGGMVTTRSEAYVEKLRQFRNHGFEMGEGHRRKQTALGYNYRLSDIHAALGRSQLAKLDEFIERRRQIAYRYMDALDGVVKLPPSHEGHAWHLFVIRTPERDRLYRELAERGIQTQVHYGPVSANPFYGGHCDLPETNAYYEQALSLPIFPSFTDAEQTQVIKAVRDLV